MRLMLLALVAACSDKPAPADDSSPTDDSAEDSLPDDSPDDTDDTQPQTDPGVLMLAGGGSEGEMTDTAAWSWALYQGLLSGGDINGDGAVKVAVLSDTEETDWIPNYFVTLGATSAFNLHIDSRQTAQSDRTAQQIADADAVFIKGGDQGIYYDLWNDTATEQAILELWRRGGGVGGTSAGAMSLSQYSLSGSADYVSADVLTDSHTVYLDDVSEPGTSGVHTDFFGLLPNAYVDTHFTERGRLGRALGVLARAIDEGAPSTIVGIGLEQQTGVIVRGDQVEVFGAGTVAFIQPTTAAPIREPGLGLVWTDIRLDVLTHGAGFDLSTLTAIPAPSAEPITVETVAGPAPEGWTASGGDAADRERFALVVETEPFTTRTGATAPLLPAAFGWMDAHNSDDRGLNHELCFRALYAHPGALCALVGDTGRLSASGGVLGFAVDESGQTETSSLIIDSASATHRALSPTVSAYDGGDGSLHAAGLIGLRVHALARTDRLGMMYDPTARAVVSP